MAEDEKIQPFNDVDTESIDYQFAFDNFMSRNHHIVMSAYIENNWDDYMEYATEMYESWDDSTLDFDIKEGKGKKEEK